MQTQTSVWTWASAAPRGRSRPPLLLAAGTSIPPSSVCPTSSQSTVLSSGTTTGSAALSGARSTRKARSRTEAYRWRGRSQQHVLTSGMDDYPRGPPHAGELHLDLISWMGFFTRTMREIADFIGEADDAASFGEIEKGIIQNIDGECKSRSYCCKLTPSMQTCTGTKRGRCIATSTLMMTVRTEYTHIHTNPMRLHRRIISRLPRRLPLPVPVHALPPATELPPCRCHFADAP